VAEFGSDRNEYSNLDPQIIARIQSPNAAVGRLVGWFFLKVRKGGSNFSGHGKKMLPKSQEDSLSLKKQVYIYMSNLGVEQLP